MTDLKAKWTGWDLGDRLMVAGGLGMAVLSFFPWFSATMGDTGYKELAGALGAKTTHSEAGIGTWHGWVALICGALCVLWVMAPALFLTLDASKRKLVPLLAPSVGLVLGPVAFFARVDSSSGLVESGTNFLDVACSGWWHCGRRRRHEKEGSRLICFQCCLSMVIGYRSGHDAPAFRIQ